MKYNFEVDLTGLENTAKNLLKIAMYSIIFPILIFLTARILNVDEIFIVSKIGLIFCLIIATSGLLLYCLFLATISTSVLLYIVIGTIKLMFTKKDQ